ncbi:MAG: M48 family metalloprotease [Acidobacteriaceae bacterium]|nr:M48 family metalloprotease [Acidobacteriaceae bacterium]
MLVGALLVHGQLSYARIEIAPCKNHYSPEQQIQLGQKAAQQVYKQLPVLPDTSPITDYIQQLGQKLAAQAPGYKWPYNFHVANVAEINAFALPGGTIFVNLGTIQAAANESQLAGVMAHEISHVVLQHSVCNAEKQQRVGVIAGLGQIAAGVLLGGAAGEIAQQGIGMTAGLGFLKMSRAAEKEADLLGVGILYDAGYDPHGMSQFFETIQAKYGAGGAQFMSDHPNPGNRTEYVDKEIATLVPRSSYITTSPEFALIHKEVTGMRAYTAREVASGVWKRQGPNQTVESGADQPAGDTAASTPVDLNTSGAWKTFRGSGFSIDVPADWQAYGSQLSATLAPAGGIARSANGRAGNVIYGLLTDVYQPQRRMTMGAALDTLINDITDYNPGLVPGPQTELVVNGLRGKSVECENPSRNSGRGERDWIVAFQQGDGTLRYFAFIAPTPDFEKVRPTFAKMMQTIRLN